MAFVKKRYWFAGGETGGAVAAGEIVGDAGCCILIWNGGVPPDLIACGVVIGARAVGGVIGGWASTL